MSSVKNIQKIQPVEKSKKNVRDTVLTNIVKMLTERKLLNKELLEENITKITSTIMDSLVYKIKLDTKDDGIDTLFVKIIPQKITAVKKSSGISEFLETYKKDKKIVIVTSVGTKARQFIDAKYKNTEIFTEENMMINLVDHVLVPKHELLSPEKTNTFYTDFKCKKRNMPKMFTGDPVARYFNMKSNDIVRITRPSDTSGSYNSYRLVVKGEVK
jgi:DNA-directed RNA polymerase subunit H (RpoH/RPB5)